MNGHGEIIKVSFDDAFLRHLDVLVKTAVYGETREEVVQYLVRRQVCDIAGSPGFKNLFFPEKIEVPPGASHE